MSNTKSSWPTLIGTLLVVVVCLFPFVYLRYNPIEKSEYLGKVIMVETVYSDIGLTIIYTQKAVVIVKDKPKPSPLGEEAYYIHYIGRFEKWFSWESASNSVRVERFYYTY